MSEGSNLVRGTLKVLTEPGRHGFMTEEGMFIGFLPPLAAGWFPAQPGEFQHQGKVTVNVSSDSVFLALHPAPDGEKMAVQMELGISDSPQDTTLAEAQIIMPASLQSTIVQTELDLLFGLWTLSITVIRTNGGSRTYWILLNCMDYQVGLIDPGKSMA